MTQRLSKLAEYLYNENFEMAVEHHESTADPRRSYQEPQEVQLLLAKAYFFSEKYPKAQSIATRLKNSPSTKVAYESSFIEYKAQFMLGRPRRDVMQALLPRVRRQGGQNSNKLCRQIDEVLEITSKKYDNSPMARSMIGSNEREQFERLLKQEDDNSIVMEGMPMFLVSAAWFQNWSQYTATGQKIQKQKKHPGPITQFDIIDHIYNIFVDPRSNKDYTNRYVFPSAAYKIIPKKCWNFLKEKYGGIEVKRYNISFIDKPYEIFTEIHLKRIQIACVDNNKPEQKKFVYVQITKKEGWEGLKVKLSTAWGQGQIFLDEGKGGKKVTETQNFEEIDTIGKRYLYIKGKEINGNGVTRAEKCGSKKCNKTQDLKFCQCKTIRYCSMECLKQDWKNHKAKCELEQEHIRRRPVTFKQFNLQEKDFGGRKGVVGLKNLGNTCYMNSGLQCLSNTRELTEYFMKDDFKSHINHSNPLGTKGNLACAYAELIRQMWTGTSDSLAPTKLKKKLGQFATQFSGYGQQDSQQLISYLIDGLQQDLNLVKKKENFQVSDQIKPDEQMSRESQLNYSKRIQSYIRSLMVGQFKSTVICSSCNKISVCFDPYMLISLPIPINKDSSFYFVPNLLDKGAVKISFQYSSTTTLRSLSREFARVYNENYYRQIREGKRGKLAEEKIVFLTLNSDNFKITQIYTGKETINSVGTSNILFFLQVPECSPGEQLFLCEYQYSGERSTYPRFLKFQKSSGTSGKDAVIAQSLQRGLPKSTTRSSYSELVVKQQITTIEGLPFRGILVDVKEKLKLSTFVEGYNEGFNRRLAQSDETPLVLQDCFKNFSQKEKLEKENSWYCSKCKQFKEASKQMEIYKTNKVLVLAFKRFSRLSKITVPIKYPIEGLDIGPYLLSNKRKEPVLYDLYGVVNHHGSLYGGHYTAYCQNFLTKRWYEFNDSRVSEISKNEIVTPYSYVLFYRLRDK